MKRVRLAATIGAALVAAACGGDGGTRAAPTTTGAPAPGTIQSGLTGNITVLAAGSLTEAFNEIGEAFEAAYPGTRVTFSFGASSALATQANEGVPADLIATADEATMQRVTDAGNAGGATVFARNRLAILVGEGNPEGIDDLADLAGAGVTFVLCAAEVPCGRFGQQALDRAGVTARPRSYEETVKAVVTKVTLGEADAGIVYATDARAAADKAEGVDIPDEHNVLAVYPLAVLDQAPEPAVAAAFEDFVLSTAGQAVLGKYGFLPPT